ncbi:MAG: hypothetical protein MK102_04695 [Fuerstiella sp.]|nr:hypothetical protein [Fuerstiella sp.]
MVNLRQFPVLLISAVLCCQIAKAEESSEVVEIPDEALRNALLEQKRKRQKEGDDITVEDLHAIYSFMVENRGISDLTGLEHCINLGEARFGKNKIKDVTALAECKNLQSLSIQYNEIADLKPLGKLTKLQYLNFEHNKVTSLEGLETLDRLTSLYGSHNQIESIEPAAQLQKLWTLSLNHNKIKDLSPIAELPRLDSIGLAHNKIKDVSKLPPGKTVYSTYFQGNQIEDIGPLANMAQADANGNRQFASFWKLYLAGNPLSDESKSTHLKTLKGSGVRLNMEYNK